ncbi:MAG TPA: hypothetical protein VI997_10990, partial [Candidatus Thermoplasmatota archaeon]|nr:hypothetical protein [Candidatus Thermoplasmatota archaeon]
VAPGAAAIDGAAPEGETRPVEAESLLALPSGDPEVARIAFLAQLARGGVVSDGVVAAAGNPLPPATVFQDAHPTCDLDGDGVSDGVSNDFALGTPPLHNSGATTVRAFSGGNGTTLWTRDALNYGTFSIGEASTERPGRPFPGNPGNVIPSLDLDGDGTCDVLAIGYDGDDGISVPPVFTVASVTTYLVEVRALSGRTGEDIWVVRPDPLRADANTPLLRFASASVVRGFPTGFLAFADEEGAHFVLKTTDITYTLVQDPLGFNRIRLLPRQARLLDDRVHYESLEITEHVQLRDAKDGALLWQRDLVSGTEGGATNLTWITGVADVSQDGVPEVVLDQLVLTNPRGTEMDHPLTGQPLYRYGRGMAVQALDGAGGNTVWESTVLDPLAAQPNPPVEELFEHMVWTHAEVVDDLDADGAPDVMASYVAREENLGATASGAFRTHFLPLHGADGTAIWDVRQQGWGFLRTLGSDGERTLLGLGMVDVPSAPAPGGAFPQKFVRLGALDAADGTTVWSYEHAFAQQSMLSYHLSLAQYDEALAPFDADGDGVLDVLSPSEAVQRTERDQLLLATASHAYELRSGADGSVLRAVTAWGVDGRALACGSEPDTLTVLTGHARRLDLTRFDLATGAQLWRRPVWNDPAPRAATSAIDLVGLAARCADLPDGRTFLSLDLQEFSFDRNHEVVAIGGYLDAAGAPTWLTPAVRGDPPIVDIFEPYREPPTGPSPLAVAAFAAPAGAAAGVAALALGSRAAGGVLGRLLGVGLVAMLVLTGAPMAAPPVTALDAPSLELSALGANAAPAPQRAAPEPAAEAASPVASPQRPPDPLAEAAPAPSRLGSPQAL